MPRFVDVERRRAAHAAAYPAYEVVMDAGCMDLVRQLSGKPLHVEPELVRVGAEVLVAQAPLVTPRHKAAVARPEELLRQSDCSRASSTTTRFAR